MIRIDFGTWNNWYLEQLIPINGTLTLFKLWAINKEHRHIL